MADVEAKLIVKVVDEATNSLKEIKKTVGGVQDSIQNSRREIRNFGLVATAAGAAITGALLLTINAAREQVAVEKQLNAVLQSTAGVAGITAREAKNLASSLEGVTNFSDDAALSAESIILQFTKIGKDIFPRATEAALDISQRLGRDLTTVALQLGKALNDPADAMNALARAGVQVSDSQGQVIKSLMESGQTAQAQQVLLDELSKKYGGAARAAADPWIQLKNTLNNVMEEIGGAVLPVLNDLVKALLPVVRAVGDWIKQHPELTKWIVLTVGALGTLLAILGPLSLAILSVTTVLGAFAVLTGPGGLILLAIAALVAAIAFLITHWDDLKAAAGSAVDFITSKMQSLLDLIELVYRKLMGVQDFRGPALQSGKDLSLEDVQAAKPRAGGGTVREPWTLVGEEGPELVSLPRGSHVHTNKESQGMMSPSITIGAIHVHNEADEDRLVAKLTRLLQLQRLQAA